jgi:glycosyltransferase involved in cell wall biosynthesis
MTSRQKTRMVTRLSKGEPTLLQKGSGPRLSVILCTYNRCNLVLNALTSLRRQTLSYADFEILVIDNGSSDSTLNAVRHYVSAGRHEPRKNDEVWKVQCLSEPKNGLAYARNTGLLAASGEIAVFLDDDTVADPYFLERLLQAYDETGADAIGGKVEMRWEAARPYWLTDDMLELLGYFSPSKERMELPAPISFSSSCFSVKIAALRTTGYFSPFLSKRRDLPASTEIQHLCHRLRAEGYRLWYEPSAQVFHCIPATRLKREFFTGRAYWQGRSEVLSQYRDEKRQNTAAAMRSLYSDIRSLLFLGLIHRPLLSMADRPTSERMDAAMEQARIWGRVQQRLSFLEHAPANITEPSVLFVRSEKPDPTANLLMQSLQDIYCTPGDPDVPLSWLWRHRAYQGRAIGILHFYRPGSLDLSHRQRQRLWFRLWLAHRLGVRVVTTDAGGWWQSTQGLRYLARRAIERNLMARSHIIISYTRQPEQLYPDKKLRRRLRCLPHPGFYGTVLPPVQRDEARKRLAFPPVAGFAFLCLASHHTERELIYLLESFSKAVEQFRKSGPPSGISPLPPDGPLQLLLVGRPGAKEFSSRILKLAAINPNIHLHSAEPTEEDIALYTGAVDALVLPHFAIRTAGMLELAMLALSYGRVIVAPRLPRFSGMLPPRATSYYEPNSHESLARAMLEARQLDYHLTERDIEALNAETGWGQYADRLGKIYREILERKM